jgi:hypothetical protein
MIPKLIEQIGIGILLPGGNKNGGYRTKKTDFFFKMGEESINLGCTIGFFNM